MRVKLVRTKYFIKRTRQADPSLDRLGNDLHTIDAILAGLESEKDVPNSREGLIKLLKELQEKHGYHKANKHLDDILNNRINVP